MTAKDVAYMLGRRCGKSRSSIEWLKGNTMSFIEIEVEE